MQWFHRSTKCGRGRRRGRRRRRRTNSARISHPPPFRRVTKNGEVPHYHEATLVIMCDHKSACCQFLIYSVTICQDKQVQILLFQQLDVLNIMP